MAKRGNNIYKRKDGRYEGRVIVGRNVEGRYQYRYVYDRSLSGVKQKLEEARQQQKAAGDSCRLTVRYVMQLWLAACKDKWKPTTYAAYRQMSENAIFPYIGTLPASKLDEAAVQSLLKALRDRSESGQISQGYLKRICMLLRQSLLYVKKTYHYNITLPEFPLFRPASPARKLPDEDDLQKLDSYLREHAEEDTCLGILLAKYTGIRIGELCALHWEDIDTKESLLYIRGNLQRVKTYDEGTGATKVQMQLPKTENSIRILPIPNSILPLLKQYAREPEQYFLTGQKNPWAEVRTVQYRFKAILNRLEIPQFNFHMLRHSFASTCIRRGCDMKSLSEMLGHSNIQITMNLYVHTSLEQKREALNKVFADL